MIRRHSSTLLPPSVIHVRGALIATCILAKRGLEILLAPGSVSKEGFD